MKIDSTNIQFCFSEKIPPAGWVDSGEVVTFCCQDCYAEQIDCDGKDFSLLDMQRNNPVTGPLSVRGAEPGDVLQVDILQIDMNKYGTMCVRKGVGIYEVEGCHCRRFPIIDNVIQFDCGIKIPVKPMIGEIGTSPAGDAVSVQPPGEHGGNLDINELGVGSTIYLPVAVPGALLSVGDLHAVQGDGETAICAMEVSGDVTLRVTVLKQPKYIPTPMVVTDTACYTTAADASLDVCSVEAGRKMHRWMVEEFDITDAQAAMLLSLQGNLRISQVVNPLKGCVMEMPRTVLKQLRRRSEA